MHVSQYEDYPDVVTGYLNVISIQVADELVHGVVTHSCDRYGTGVFSICKVRIELRLEKWTGSQNTAVTCDRFSFYFQRHIRELTTMEKSLVGWVCQGWFHSLFRYACTPPKTMTSHNLFCVDIASHLIAIDIRLVSDISASLASALRILKPTKLAVLYFAKFQAPYNRILTEVQVLT